MKKFVIVMMLMKFVLLDTLMIIPTHPVKAQDEVACSNDLHNCIVQDVVLAGGVAVFEAGASVGLWTSLAPFLGLGSIASLLSLFFLNPQPSFEQRLKADLSELQTAELPNINKNLCKQNGTVLKILTELPEVLGTVQAVNAAKEVYDLANISENKLDDIKEALSAQGRFSTLNTQGANVTVHTTDDKLHIESGGNKEDKYKKAFYLPKLVRGLKDVLKQSASLRGHTGVALLFEGSGVSSIFSRDVSTIEDYNSDTKKALVRGYKLIENNNDIPSVLVNSFLDGEFKDTYALNTIADFIYEDAERLELVSYTQRLLQDLGISGPSGGEFTPSQLDALIRITPSMTSDVSPEDLYYVKNLAYKVRNIFIGIASGDFVVNTDREDGQHAFIGAIIGNYAKGVSGLKYNDILDMYITGKTDVEVINELTRLGISRKLFDAKSDKILDLIVDQISILLPGERRKEFIDDMLKIVLALKEYATRQRNVQAEKDLEATEIVLLGYGQLENILKNKEDYFGILFNSRQAKLNTLRRANKAKSTTANNNAIATIDVIGPRNAMKDVLMKQNIEKEDRVTIAVYAAIGTARGFIKGLMDMDDFESTAEKPRISTQQKAKKMVAALNRVNNSVSNGGVKAAIKNLKRVARIQSVASGSELEYYLALGPENLPRGLNPAVAIGIYIETELQPKKAMVNSGNNKTKYPGLKILIDKDLAQRSFYTDSFGKNKVTYETYIRDYFENHKKTTYLVDGVRAKTQNVKNGDWLSVVDEGTEITDDDGDESIFKKRELEFARKKMTRKAVDELDASDYITLVKNNVIDEVGTDQTKVFSLKAVKCASKTEDAQNNKFMAGVILHGLELTPLSNNTSILDGFNLKGKIILDQDYVELGAEIILKDSKTGKNIYQQPIPLEASALALSANSLINVAGNNINLKGAIEAVEKFGIAEGITNSQAARRIMPFLRLVGKVTLLGAPGVTVVIATIALEIVAEKIILEALLEEEGNPEEDPKIAPISEPLVACYVVPNIVMAGEAATIYYYSGGAEYASVRANPYFSSSFLPVSGSVTINPTMDVDVSVAARSITAQLAESMCAVKVRDEETAQVIGKVDDQFVNGTDGEMSVPWGYSLTFDVSGEEAEISSFTLETPPISVIPGNHTTLLKVANKDTIMNDVLVNLNEVKYVEHKGGVFRHYGSLVEDDGSEGKIPFINREGFFPPSSFGDLYEKSPEFGAGVYLTDLNVEPSSIDNLKYIARKIRKLKVGGLDQLKTIPVGEETDEELAINIDGYIDVLFDRNKKNLISDERFNYQFLYPFILTIDNDSVYKLGGKFE